MPRQKSPVNKTVHPTWSQVTSEWIEKSICPVNTSGKFRTFLFVPPGQMKWRVTTYIPALHVLNSSSLGNFNSFNLLFKALFSFSNNFHCPLRNLANCFHIWHKARSWREYSNKNLTNIEYLLVHFWFLPAKFLLYIVMCLSFK